MNPFSQPFTPDTDAKRNGKIAHLPRPCREKLNQLLYEGQSAVQLARWLNELPLVKTILANHFGGRPISPQNLSEWKQGGYREWLRHQQLLRQTNELAANAGDFAQAADGLADSLFGLLTLDYTQTLMNRENLDPAEFEKQRKALSFLAQDIVRLRRCHLNARRVELQEERLDQTQEKTSEQLFEKFVQWAGNPAIRKAFLLAPMEHMRQLRQHFGMPPRPHDEALSRLTENDPDFKPSGPNQTKNKPNQAQKNKSSSNRSSGRESALTDSSPSTGRSRGDEALNENENATVLRDSSSSDEHNSTLKTQNSEFPDLRPPEITSDKTNVQIMAEIEEYANQVSLRKRSSSASTGSSRGLPRQSEAAAGDEALTSFSQHPDDVAPSPNEDANCPTASPSPGGEGRGDGGLKTNSQLPLSDYDQARLEGKSHLEALYAQFTPTPEELERRKRENESLRNPGGTGYQPAAPSTLNSPNSQQFYGPCPSPLGWHGHRYLDTSKVQTG